MQPQDGDVIEPQKRCEAGENHVFVVPARQAINRALALRLYAASILFHTLDHGRNAKIVQLLLHACLGWREL